MSAAALVMSAGFVGGPALARAIATNSDKVDGLHAVKATASTAQRKGKLVATDPTTGAFRANVIPNDAKFPATAPAGVKLSGVWGFDVQSAGAGGDYGSSLDFGTRLPVDPTPLFSSSGGSIPHCPGTVDQPAADPGYVCLYLYGGGGLNLGGFVGSSIGRQGLVFRFPSTAGSANVDVFANGTWAVTASATTPMKTRGGYGK